MKLLRLRIFKSGFKRKILDGFDQYFDPLLDEDDKANPIVLVGKNGTGKSQLLELLSRIFYFLDKKYRLFEPDTDISTDIAFEIEYLFWVEDSYERIRIANLPKGKKMTTEVFNIGESTTEEISFEDVRHFLPRHVIGYSSGENETLSLPFLDTNYEYGKYVRDLGLKPKDISYDFVPTTSLIFPDYSSNLAVFIANYLLRSENDLDLFREDELIQLDTLHSFRISIRLKHKAAPGNGVKLTQELTDAIDKLRTCSTCYSYDEKYESYIFDYFVNEATRKAFKHYFDSAFELYMIFYKLDLLNSLIPPRKEMDRVRKLRREGVVEKLPVVSAPDKVFNISQIRLKVKNVPDPIEYIGLSDGQHQFVHVFGMMMMIDQDNVFFLLDEPETHFNPEWRSNFIKILNRITEGRKQEYFTTTHSPFILSDSKRERVFIFDADGTIRQPIIETYGASVETLLMEAFDMPIPIAKDALSEIEELKKLDDPDEIEQKLKEYGDSVEKFYLRRRIRELRNQKNQNS